MQNNMNTVMNTVINAITRSKQEFNPSEIENICFKGGGIKGVAFLGVYKALIELKRWDQVKRIIGSSAGAIFATALACHISYDKLENIIKNTDFTRFRDSRMYEPYELIREMGLYSGANFYNWISYVLQESTGDGNITFEEIYKKYKMELIITTTDLTDKKLVYLNHNDNPNMKVADAIRKSMSIPVFYTPVIEDGHVFVDGGCLNNYPLDYFDNFYKEIPAFSKTLGFNLIENTENIEINNVIELVTRLINTEIEELEHVRLNKNDSFRTVNIPTFDIQATDFDITVDKINMLIGSGYVSTINFFGKFGKSIWTKAFSWIA